MKQVASLQQESNPTDLCDDYSEIPKSVIKVLSKSEWRGKRY